MTLALLWHTLLHPASRFFCVDEVVLTVRTRRSLHARTDPHRTRCTCTCTCTAYCTCTYLTVDPPTGRFPGCRPRAGTLGKSKSGCELVGWMARRWCAVRCGSPGSRPDSCTGWTPRCGRQWLTGSDGDAMGFVTRCDGRVHVIAFGEGVNASLR